MRKELILIFALVFLTGCCSCLDDGGNSGASGTSFEDAVVITGADSLSEEIDFEDQWLAENACQGKGGVDWDLLDFDVQEYDEDLFDVLYVTCLNGDKETYYFKVFFYSQDDPTVY